ncbi:hypothetical protein D3C76_169680 [compost metagenome]
MKKVLGEDVKVLTENACKKIAGNDELSKSQRIKDLFDGGMEVKDIATLMNVRYNFAYNVLSNYSTVNKIETVTNKKSGKKEAIINLFIEGKSNKEISGELETNYNYVFNTIKAYKLTDEYKVLMESKEQLVINLTKEA